MPINHPGCAGRPLLANPIAHLSAERDRERRRDRWLLLVCRRSRSGLRDTLRGLRGKRAGFCNPPRAPPSARCGRGSGHFTRAALLSSHPAVYPTYVIGVRRIPHAHKKFPPLAKALLLHLLWPDDGPALSVRHARPLFPLLTH